MYLCIFVSLYLCIYLSVYLSIYLSIDLSIPNTLAVLSTYILQDNWTLKGCSGQNENIGTVPHPAKMADSINTNWGWTTKNEYLCTKLAVQTSLLESLPDEYRRRPDCMQIVQVRDIFSKLRSMAVGDAGWRTRAYLAQPKPTGIKLRYPWCNLRRTLATWLQVPFNIVQLGRVWTQVGFNMRTLVLCGGNCRRSWAQDRPLGPDWARFPPNRPCGSRVALCWALNLGPNPIPDGPRIEAMWCTWRPKSCSNMAQLGSWPQYGDTIWGTLFNTKRHRYQENVVDTIENALWGCRIGPAMSSILKSCWLQLRPSGPVAPCWIQVGPKLGPRE